MTAHDALSVAIGLMNLTVAVVLVIHVRRLGIRPPLPLVILGAVFAIRATARLVPPIGEDPDGLDLILDVGLFFALVLLVGSARRLVTTFAHERDALERARIDYDDALFRHETAVVDAVADQFERLDASLDEIAAASDDASRGEALTRARESLAALRERTSLR